MIQVGKGKTVMWTKNLLASEALTAALAASGHAITLNAQSIDDSAAAVAGEVAHARKMMQRFADTRGTSPGHPGRRSADRNRRFERRLGAFNPTDPRTPRNAFFHRRGTNRRTCLACHEGQYAWRRSAQHAQDRIAAGSNVLKVQ